MKKTDYENDTRAIRTKVRALQLAQLAMWAVCPIMFFVFVIFLMLAFPVIVLECVFMKVKSK